MKSIDVGTNFNYSFIYTKWLEWVYVDIIK